MIARTHQVAQHRSAIPGIEAMTLTSNHAFPRHSHDHFGIGVIVVGAQRSWSGVGEVEACAGDAIMVNPGEMHDGVPLNGRVRAWRMLYLDPALLARETADEASGQIEIARPAVRDPILVERFARLFASVTASTPDHLAIEENLLRSLMHVLRRHAMRPPTGGGRSPRVARVLGRLDATPEAPASLAELAALAGVSRFQLLRGFAREVGATPHAYLLQRRVHLARQFLAAGQRPAEAAMQAGFADQSHMTRAFVRQFGVTPGRYRAALV
jgi:AraC-like DNA-binding protein